MKKNELKKILSIAMIQTYTHITFKDAKEEIERIAVNE